MTGNTLDILTATGAQIPSSFTSIYMEKLWAIVTLEFMAKFFVIYFFVIWIALILWVVRDISYRSSSAFLQAFCILLIIFLTPL